MNIITTHSKQIHRLVSYIRPRELSLALGITNPNLPMVCLGVKLYKDAKTHALMVVDKIS